jgi:glutamate carboxypeptidase
MSYLEHASSGATEDAIAMLKDIRAKRNEFVDFLRALCEVESPTDHPETQSLVHALIAPALKALDFDVRIISGRVSGNHLLAVPRNRTRGTPTQLLIGHSDTVWPRHTLERMPVRVDDGKMYGPGTLDMKGGLTQIIFALRALREHGVEPSVAPIIFVNADEEVGSPDSQRHVRRLARQACRALVLEPSLGPAGLIKTARKGVGRFEIRAHGRASHAGLDPESGASAIVELAHVIQEVDALNAPSLGRTINVGLVDGGTRPNVIPAEAGCVVDVRVETSADGAEVERLISAIEPVTPGVSLEVAGGMQVPPLERTPRNQQLWQQATAAGAELGLDLGHTMAGGGSDGNTTSLFTATLDGLGCVGAGAHADHEHIVIDPSLDRCALLARLLMMPLAASVDSEESS